VGNYALLKKCPISRKERVRLWLGKKKEISMPIEEAHLGLLATAKTDWQEGFGRECRDIRWEEGPTLQLGRSFLHFLKNYLEIPGQTEKKIELVRGGGVQA